MTAAVRPRLCWLGPSDTAAPIVDGLTERVDVIVLDGPPADAWCAAEAAVADCLVAHPSRLDERPGTLAAARRLALDLLDGTSALAAWREHVERADLLLFADEDQAVVIADRLAADGVRTPPWRVVGPGSEGTPLADWLYETEAAAPGDVGPAPSRVDQLQAALQSLVEELEERGRRLDAAEAALREAQEEHRAAQASWEPREAALQGTADAFEQQLREIEAELQAARDRAASLETLHAVMEQERDVVTAELAQLREAVASAGDEASAQLAAAADEAQALQARIVELQQAEGTAAQQTAAASEMQAQLAQAEQRLQEARDREVAATAARAESEAQLSHVRAQLTESHAVAAAQERRLNAVRKIPGAVWLWRLLFKRDGTP